METGEIDSTVAAAELATAPTRMVDCLKASERARNFRFLGIHSVGRRPDDIDAALAGTFRHHDERFTLAPPIDWWDEPYTGANERGFFQNSFTFADPLLAAPRFPEVLAPLAAIFVDWLSANPQTGSAHPHRYAWHDHAAAGRIVTMAFVLREGLRRAALDRETAETLAAGVQAHADYLLAPENYAAHNNHGFASDAALTLAARSLAPAPEAKSWADVAGRRFASVLDHMIDREEAIHLEHSPAYHWILRGALRRFAAAELFEEHDLVGLTHRMDESGAWLLAPDGTLPPLGDTALGVRPPHSVARSSVHCKGMKVFPRSGYAAVRAGESALLITAAHHATAHKHADDGSFCLYEKGRPIVLDSGNPGYEYESPEFRYGTSPGAHATVSVDGFDWAKGAPPYGSGIVASATHSDDLFGLLMRNPNAVPGGGAARRVLAYAPARFLLVIDDVDATGKHQLARHLPLAPGLEARPGSDGKVEILDSDTRLACLVQVVAPDSSPDEVLVASGLHVPELRGFRFVSPEEARVSCDLTLAGPAGRLRAYALLLDPHHAGRPPAMTSSGSEGELDICVTGLTDSPLEIRVTERSLGLSIAE